MHPLPVMLKLLLLRSSTSNRSAQHVMLLLLPNEAAYFHPVGQPSPLKLHVILLLLLLLLHSMISGRSAQPAARPDTARQQMCFSLRFDQLHPTQQR
jgi:hypothetical protein